MRIVYIVPLGRGFSAIRLFVTRSFPRVSEPSRLFAFSLRLPTLVSLSSLPGDINTRQTVKMSTQRVFASVLPRLRVASSKNATTSLAQQAQQLRCYSRPTATLRPSGPARSSVLSSAAASAPAPRRVCVPATSSTQPRTLSTSASLFHGHVDTPKPGEELWVTFIDKEGVETKIAVCKGDNLLDIAQAHDLEMEGACGGSCACSTCHVIVEDPDYYDKMPEPDDDENDMLDLAFGLTETSRLGCQVIMTPELDGLRVKLPPMTRNLQSSDFN